MFGDFIPTTRATRTQPHEHEQNVVSMQGDRIVVRVAVAFHDRGDARYQAIQTALSFEQVR